MCPTAIGKVCAQLFDLDAGLASHCHPSWEQLLTEVLRIADIAGFRDATLKAWKMGAITDGGQGRGKAPTSAAGFQRFDGAVTGMIRIDKSRFGIS